MPTSSQALAYLKNVTESGGEQAWPADSTSACHLPNVFPQRYEEDAESSSQVGLRVFGEVLQQRPQGRPLGGELILPPINRSNTHPLILAASEQRKIAEKTRTNTQSIKRWREGRGVDEPKSMEHCNNVGIDAINNPQFQQNTETQASRRLQERARINSDQPHNTGQGGHDPAFLSGSNLGTVPVSAWSYQLSIPSDVWTQEDAPLTPGANDPSDVWTQEEAPMTQSVNDPPDVWTQEDAPLTRGVNDPSDMWTQEDAPLTRGVNDPSDMWTQKDASLTRGANDPSDVRTQKDATLTPGVNDPPDAWTQEATPLTQSVNDPSCRKPAMTCVLNLNLWDQSCETQHDDTSCIGVLCYNPERGRHEWGLVPHNSPAPFRAVRGRYIKSMNPADNSAMSALSDQSGNFSEGAQLKRGSEEDLWPQRGVSELFNNLHEEEIKNRQELSGHEDVGRWQTQDPDATHAYSTHFQFAGALNKQDYPQTNTSFSSDSIRRFDNQTWNHRLKPSGIIYNESYIFENDAEDMIPHFLETLMSAPRAGEEVSLHYLPDIAESDYCFDDSSAPLLECHSFKVAQRPAVNQRRIDKIRPSSHKSRPKKVNVRFREPPEPVPLKCLSPEPRSKVEEQKDTLVADPEQDIIRVDPVLPSDTTILLSTPAEPRVLRMRTELPPSQPNRLCFRSSLSGCSHNEVISGIESLKNVKVTWLQYEPISLHYTDVAKPDYRHLCMWLFEVSNDSDTSGLLLEGFMLRGQHMNVLHLDDVYLEEFRTFSMCNEVLMEQRSKHLIKHKSKRLPRSSPVIL